MSGTVSSGQQARAEFGHITPGSRASLVDVAASALACAAPDRVICVPQNDRLAVCWCGFGLLPVTGCGYPQIERILGVTEQVLDVVVRGVLGGLHLPVHPLDTPLVPQAVLGFPELAVGADRRTRHDTTGFHLAQQRGPPGVWSD